MYNLPFTICEVFDLGINKIGASGRVWAWRSLSLFLCLGEILIFFGDRLSRACCHKSRIWLSVGALVSSCSKELEEVGVGRFGVLG
jgi:hypothetical protein